MSCETSMLSKLLTNSVQLLSLVLLFVTPWTGFPVHHQLPELTQTHVHRVGDDIQPSHHLLSPSPAFNISKHPDLFQRISSLHHVASIGVSVSASVLPVNIQDLFPLGWTDENVFQSKGLSRVFSNTTVQKHQFFGAQLSL